MSPFFHVCRRICRTPSFTLTNGFGINSLDAPPTFFSHSQSLHIDCFHHEVPSLTSSRSRCCWPLSSLLRLLVGFRVPFLLQVECSWSPGNFHGADISTGKDDPNNPDLLIGLNCRGSAGCGLLCRTEIATSKGYVRYFPLSFPLLPPSFPSYHLSQRSEHSLSKCSGTLFHPGFEGPQTQAPELSIVQRCRCTKHTMHIWLRNDRRYDATALVLRVLPAKHRWSRLAQPGCPGSSLRLVVGWAGRPESPQVPFRYADGCCSQDVCHGFSNPSECF